MSGLLLVVLLALAIVATGCSILHWLRVDDPSRLFRLGLAIGAGQSSVMLALYLPLCLFDQVSFAPALVLLGVGSLHALWLARGALWKPPGFVLRWQVAAMALIFGLPLCILALQPFTGYDDKAIFGLKGKILLYERGVHGPLFQDVDLVHFHADYPLGVPLLMALSGWVAEGEPSDPQGLLPAASAEEWVARHDAVDAYMVLSLLWVVGIFLLVAGSVMRLSPAPVLAAGLVALVLPVLQIGNIYFDGGWHSFADADRPLTSCLGVAGVGLARWLDKRSVGSLTLALLCAAGAVLVKQEALVALGLLAVVALAHGAKSRALRGSLLLGLSAGAALALVRIVTSRTAGAPYDEQYLQALSFSRTEIWLERLPQLLPSLWTPLERSYSITFWLLFALLAAPVAWRGGGASRVLLLWVAAYLLAMLGVMVVTPNHMVFHVDTALHRLWAEMTLPASVLLVEAIAWAWFGSRSPARLEAQAAS